VTLALAVHESGRDRMIRLDVRTGKRLEVFTPEDSVLHCCPLPLPGGGWAWVSRDDKGIELQRPGDARPRRFAKPVWFKGPPFEVSPDGERALYAYDNALGDTTTIEVLSLRTGARMPWLKIAAREGMDPYWLTDGSILVIASGTQDSRTFYRLRAPGRVDSLGTIPRPVFSVDVTPDLRRAVINTREYLGDAWMYRVERR